MCEENSFALAFVRDFLVAVGMAVDAQYYSESMGLAMCGVQDWWVNPVSSSGLDADASNFNPQQLPQVHHLHNHYSIQDLCVDDNTSPNPFPSSSSSDKLLPMAFSQSLADQLETQRLEIDWLLHFQLERLKFALQEQRKQQLGSLLNRLESKTITLMRQKEEDLARARKKMMELEDWLRRREVESQGWQRVATENEAMVKYLNNMLEQVRETHLLLSNGAEDAESYGGGPIDRREDEGRGRDRGEGGEEVKDQCKKMACKRCNSRTSCFLFFPCRHLCSCKSCEPLLGCCPVCKSVKEASMEVFLV